MTYLMDNKKKINFSFYYSEKFLYFINEDLETVFKFLVIIKRKKL